MTVVRSTHRPGVPCWIDLSSPDPEGSARFYSGLFGWEVGEPNREARDYRTCFLDGKTVAGIKPPDQPDLPPMWTTYVSVTDIGKVTKAVEGAGGTVLAEPVEVPGMGHMAVFADPTNAAFAVWQSADQNGAELYNRPNTWRKNELNTREPEVAVEFYRAVFGWESKVEDERAYRDFYIDGKVVAGLMPMDENFPPDLPSHWLVIFQTDDLDATVRRAEDLGASVDLPPNDVPVGRFSVLSDPQGATFSVLRFNDDIE